MKEKIKELIGGLFMIAFGVFCFVIADEYVLMLFHLIEVDFRIFGGILIAAGLLVTISNLLPKKGQKRKKPAKEKPAKEKPAREKPQVAPQEQEPISVSQEAPRVDVKALVMAAREAGTPEAFRQAIANLEPYQEADPENGEITAGMLAFGGLCVTMQTASAAKGLSLNTYLIGKLLQALLSILMASLLQIQSIHIPLIWWILIPAGIAVTVKILHKRQNRCSISQLVGV